MHPNLANFDHKDQHKHNHHVLEYRKDRSTLGRAIDDSGVQFLSGETMKYTQGKTNIVPENKPVEKEIASGSYHF